MFSVASVAKVFELATRKLWFFLVDERIDALTVVSGFKIIEVCVDLGGGQRRRADGQASDEFFMPARDERRAIGDPARGRISFALDFRVGHDTRQQALRERFFP